MYNIAVMYAPSPKKRECPRLICPVRPTSRSKLAAKIADTKVIDSRKRIDFAGDVIGKNRRSKKNRRDNSLGGTSKICAAKLE
jgi:hypothetical protein